MEDLKGRQLGDYQIIEQIGKGGMASVFRAYQPSLERDVAIKVLPPYYAEQDDSFLQRFKREAKAIANLRHPNILMVLEAGEQDGLAYIVMEYVNAGTLKERLTKPITLKEIYNLVKQIASALEHAHERGIVHRDIKPSNIMLPKPDWALLTDFGLAHMVGGSMLTQSGMTVGTPAYMSPEQGRGERVDHRTDIYSLGIMLYEMTVGEVPYRAETPMAVVVKHIVDPLPIPRDKNPAIPEELQRIILKALAKNPEDRFQSAQAMVEALERVAVSHPDWSASEMKAVTDFRSLPADQPETNLLGDAAVEAGLSDDATVPPIVPLDPLPESTTPPVATGSGSAPPQPARKKKRSWPVFLGAAVVFVVCSLLGLAAIGRMFGENDGEEDLLLTAEFGLEEPAAPPEEDAVSVQEELGVIADLMAEGKLEEARMLFRQVERRNPLVWDIFLSRSVDSLYQKGEIDQAAQTLEMGLEVNQDAPPESYLMLGYLYLELGKWDQALFSFERTILRYPDNTTAYLELEFSAVQANQVPKAIQILERISAQHRVGALWHALGNLYFMEGNYDKGVQAYQNARELYQSTWDNGRQTSWTAYGLAAVLFYLEEDPAMMDKMLQEAERMGIKENDLALLQELAWLYVEMDDCSNGLRLADLIYRQFPEIPPDVFSELELVCQ